MIKLFDEIPEMKNERVLLRPIERKDLPALSEMTGDPEVYRFLPTFLYEQKYDDKNLMLDRMEEECIRTKDTILLAVCPADEQDTFMGIAEIYNYEPQKEKASIGYRLCREFWGRGIASEVTGLLKKYLLERTDVRKITAHVMVENKASAKVLLKNGFFPKWQNLSEDWGRPENVTVDKYRFKLSPEEKAETLRFGLQHRQITL